MVEWGSHAGVRPYRRLGGCGAGGGGRQRSNDDSRRHGCGAGTVALTNVINVHGAHGAGRHPTEDTDGTEGTDTGSSELAQLVSSLAWPVAVVVSLLILTTRRGRLLLAPILRRLKRIRGPGGWEVELSPEAAAETKADVEGAIKPYEPALDREYERLAHVEGIRGRLETAVREGFREPRAPGFRSTVHVEDAMVSNALYQLVGYWPGGGGSGRRFSTRFGMIGRAWEFSWLLYAGDVPESEDDLIELWGMTRAQAASAAEGRHILCVCAPP